MKRSIHALFVFFVLSVFFAACSGGGGDGAAPAPGAPTGVTAQSGDGQVTVSWNAVSDATSYNIYWKNAAGVATTDTKIPGASSPYTHTPCTNGTPYYYVVTAVNASGESGLSAEVSATPQAVVPGAPSIPQSLTATGSLNNIHLSWTASSGVNLAGYNVYKSFDGTTYTKITGTPVTGTSYDDAIVSPAGDGVYYSYKVTAMGDAESGYSSNVKSVHGTRLAANLVSGLTTTTALSPYVVEGSVVSEGSVTVVTGTQLYVLENSTFDILKGYSLFVNGLFRIIAATAAPATLTSHATGTALGPDEGFRMALSSCESYTTGGNGGTLLQNARLVNVKSGNSGGNAMDISGCKPKFYNLYVAANNTSRAAYMYLSPTSGAILQNCSLTGICPISVGDQRTTGFQMDHNIIAPGLYNYVLDFSSSTTQPINAGQISDNVFDSANQLDVAAVTAGGTIPLGNNYWKQGVPTIRYQNGSTSVPNFTPTLSSPPAGAGPTW